MAWAPGATTLEISSRGTCTAAVLQKGRTQAVRIPRSGQMAPKRWAHLVYWSWGAGGRGPRLKLELAPAFNRKFGQQTEEFAMKNANHDPNRLRQPNVLPFSASWRCYLGNLG